MTGPMTSTESLSDLLEKVETVCQPGTAACCRYLVMGPGGWGCGKLEPSLRVQIDRRSEAGTMRAKGDNCEGILS